MPDTNVLIYAVNADSPQRGKARGWLEDGYANPAGIGFAWVALPGFVRISTRRGILAHPLPVETALGLVDEWLNDSRARRLQPTARHASLLARLLLGEGRGGNLVTDAHPATIAIEHGAIFGSFERDFDRFAGLHWGLLEAPTVHKPRG